MKYVFYAILIYLAYQLIFKLIIPVYIASRRFKKQFREMHARMQEQMQQQQQASRRNEWTSATSPCRTCASNAPIDTWAGEMPMSIGPPSIISA